MSTLVFDNDECLGSFAPASLFFDALMRVMDVTPGSAFQQVVGDAVTVRMQFLLHFAKVLGMTGFREGFVRPGVGKMLQLAYSLKSRGMIDFVAMYTFAQNTGGLYTQYLAAAICAAADVPDDFYTILLSRTEMRENGIDHAYVNQQYIKKSLQVVTSQLQARYGYFEPKILMFDDLPETIARHLPPARADKAAGVLSLTDHVPAMPKEVEGVPPYHHYFVATQEDPTPATSLYIYCIFHTVMAFTSTRETKLVLLDMFGKYAPLLEAAMHKYPSLYQLRNVDDGRVGEKMIGDICNRFVPDITREYVAQFGDRPPQPRPVLTYSEGMWPSLVGGKTLERNVG